MGVEIKELIVRAIVDPQTSERSAGTGTTTGSVGEQAASGTTRQRLRKVNNPQNER